MARQKKLRSSVVMALNLLHRSFGTATRQRVVVVGGNGFVGSAVVRAAVARDCDVTVVSRHAPTAPLPAGVRWVQGDMLTTAPTGGKEDSDVTPDWRDAFVGAHAVVSSVGGFGSDEVMERVCGDTNIAAAEAAKAAGVAKFVFISAAPVPHRAAVPSFVLSGYLRGKERVEATVAKLFPEGSGSSLRPGFVYGPREVRPGLTLPLQLVGAPLAALLGEKSPLAILGSIPGLGPLLFALPLPDDAVGVAAVDAALASDADTLPAMECTDIKAKYDEFMAKGGFGS